MIRWRKHARAVALGIALGAALAYAVPWQLAQLVSIRQTAVLTTVCELRDGEAVLGRFGPGQRVESLPFDVGVRIVNIDGNVFDGRLESVARRNEWPPVMRPIRLHLTCRE